MSLAFSVFDGKPRLRALLDHFAIVDDPRDARRIAHQLNEVLLLVICGTMADCDDYEGIAAWGEAHLHFLRRYLPYEHGVPGGRWLTLLMNRINPALFSAAFTAWVRQTWPERPGLVAINGKTSGRLRRNPQPINEASSCAENSPAGTQNIWQPCSTSQRVNLDSLPWRLMAGQSLQCFGFENMIHRALR